MLNKRLNICNEFVESDNMNNTIIEICKNDILPSEVGFNDNELFKKIAISIGIRLCVEKFCIEILNLDVNDIDNSENQIWKVFYNQRNDLIKQYPEAVECFDKALISTTEYIHINTFMYEPLIDQPADFLKKLFYEAYSLSHESSITIDGGSE